MTSPEGRQYEWGDQFRATVAPSFADGVMEAWLKSLPEAMLSAETLTVSNDQALKRIPFSRDGQEISLVVKQFPRRKGARAAWDKRIGSRSLRSWTAARHLQASGLGTPEPVAVLEQLENGIPLNDWLITRELPPHESFQKRLIQIYKNSFDNIALIELLEKVALEIRKMHDAGLFHRDLGNQNIVLLQKEQENEPSIQFLDLNRARIKVPLSLSDRARDLSRIHLPSDFLRIFFEMYYRGPPPDEFLKLEEKFRSRFQMHSRSRKWRHPFRERRRAKHIQEDTYPQLQDIWIWDPRSLQAISSLRSRDRRRMISPRHSAQVTAATLRHLPAVHRQYKANCRRAFQAPVSMKHRVGCSLNPDPKRWAKEQSFLRDLGHLPVFLRFYFHESPEQNSFLIQCIRDLKEEGYPVSIAFVQNREAVLAPDEWRSFCRRILEQIHTQVEWVEMGHATNRVKWGCWTARDYEALADCIPMLRDRFPSIRFCGPAGIDFEYHRVLGSLGALSNQVYFDALSHHLYVDRRGAPENEQGGFSSWKKCALARAIASVHPRTRDEFIISEVNWPLLDTGVYSPVGSPYLYPGQVVQGPSVTEADYARYMIRYFLQTICSGMVTRVYWWNLAAHGFGLIDDRAGNDWRPRMGYRALQTWNRMMNHATFTRRSTTNWGEQAFYFESETGNFDIAYRHPESRGGPALPASEHPVLDLGGAEITGGKAETLTGSPVYRMHA